MRCPDGIASWFGAVKLRGCPIRRSGSGLSQGKPGQKRAAERRAKAGMPVVKLLGPFDVS